MQEDLHKGSPFLHKAVVSAVLGCFTTQDIRPAMKASRKNAGK